jgi:hypothetical protein
VVVGAQPFLYPKSGERPFLVAASSRCGTAWRRGQGATTALGQAISGKGSLSPRMLRMTGFEREVADFVMIKGLSHISAKGVSLGEPLKTAQPKKFFCL